MARFVWLLVVVLAVIALVRGLRQRNLPPTARGPAARGKAGLPQVMVRCAHCGVHLAEADALQAPDGHHYCSEPHRRAGPSPRPGA